MSPQAAKPIEQLAFSDLSPTDIVHVLYLVLLRRRIDPVGLAEWKRRIDAGSFSIREAIESIQASPEYRMAHKIPFPAMVHAARGEWIKQVPAAQRILDIGGSSPNIAEGAMVELGYPHRARELLVFDLPPEEQYWGKPRFAQDKPYEFAWGKLRYIHGRAERIDEVAALRDARFDLVFMGQVIEHIQPDSLPRVLGWIREHLAPAGKFVFDTPNRAITQIQIPDAYIDADHKIEYRPAELQMVLAKAGFDVERRWGLLPMPGTHATGDFNPLETYEQPLLSEDPSMSYLFAFQCVPRPGLAA